jgi:hypothetical protein
VRTDDIIAADAQALDGLQTQISGTLDNLVQTDMSSALVITLSEAHALEINSTNVQQLLIGQSAR